MTHVDLSDIKMSESEFRFYFRMYCQNSMVKYHNRINKPLGTTDSTMGSYIFESFCDSSTEKLIIVRDKLKIFFIPKRVCIIQNK